MTTSAQAPCSSKLLSSIPIHFCEQFVSDRVLRFGEVSWALHCSRPLSFEGKVTFTRRNFVQSLEEKKYFFWKLCAALWWIALLLSNRSKPLLIQSSNWLNELMVLINVITQMFQKRCFNLFCCCEVETFFLFYGEIQPPDSQTLTITSCRCWALFSSTLE